MSRLPRGSMSRAGRGVLLCLLLVCGVFAGPARTAESPVTPAPSAPPPISRAVEVAPPAGWTPDTPLFQHGAALPARPAVKRPAAADAQMPVRARSVPSAKLAAPRSSAPAVTAAAASRARVPVRFVKTADTSAAKPDRKAAPKTAPGASPKAFPTIPRQSVHAGVKPVGLEARGQAPRQTAGRTPAQ